MRNVCLAAYLVVALRPAVPAEMRASNVFGDHMVLQRDKPVKIWGWAGSGETVTVEFAGQKRIGPQIPAAPFRTDDFPIPPSEIRD